MPGAKVEDRYANFASVTVTESAASTLTAAKFAFPFSIMDKVGLVISRIEYWLDGYAALVDADDRVCLALLAASTVVNIEAQNDPLVIDSTRLTKAAAAGTGMYFRDPYVKDLSQLPGGGLLVAPNPLYAAIKATGTVAVMGCWIKLFYTYLQLEADEYWQLVESRRIITS